MNTMVESNGSPVAVADGRRRTVSKIVVVCFVGVIAFFGWRKLATIPPFVVNATEVYADNAQSATAFDHQDFDALLHAFVKDGAVDYPGLQGQAGVLDAYLTRLAAVDPNEHKRDALLAIYINAYNAATLRLILDHYPLQSIRDIPESKRWLDERWTVAGRKLSLDALEHKVLRAEFDEPRIHFAIVCASKGCPILRSEAYVPEKLDAQLNAQMKEAHADDRYFQWDAKTRTLKLTPLYKWFNSDFTRGGQGVIQFVSDYCDPSIAGALRDGRDIRVQFLDWDWSLNAKSL